MVIMLSRFNQEPLENVEILFRGIRTLIISVCMEMIDTFINTFQKNILKKKLSSILTKLKSQRLILRLRLKNGFPDVESAAEEILLITIQDYATKKIITWGRGSFNNKQENVTYKGFRTERELLNSFIDWWMIEDNTPEVVTGWNSEWYDIPYLVRAY